MLKRKAYEEIAAIIRAEYAQPAYDCPECGGGALAAATVRLASYFANTDTRFDKAKFLNACGLTGSAIRTAESAERGCC